MSRRLHVQRELYRRDDRDRYDSIVTTRDGEGNLLRCTREEGGVPCGEVVEVLFQDLMSIVGGHQIQWCAECRGDRRLLELQHPAPTQVKRLREIRAAGDVPAECRRRTA